LALGSFPQSFSLKGQESQKLLYHGLTPNPLEKVGRRSRVIPPKFQPKRSRIEKVTHIGHPRVKRCADRESNPALKLGKLQCYRYTIGAEPANHQPPELIYVELVAMAQWIRRLPTEQAIQGSSPCSDSLFGTASSVYTCVAGVKVSIVAFQAVDPGSIPGPRILFWVLVWVLCLLASVLA
jgi:hypothetical protein